MSVELKYGADRTVRLDPPAGALVAFCGLPGDMPPVDAAAAAAAALDAPLDYPPLREIALPGDKVVLALGERVPQAGAIVAAVIERLLEAGVAPADIALVQTHATVKADLAAGGEGRLDGDALAGVRPEVRDQMRMLVHDPLDRNQLSYVAASAEGKPIYVNRALSEADLVVPIGCLRPDGALAYYGPASGIFPLFSDAKTIERYRSPIADESAVQRRRFRREVEQAGWLLGLHFLVQVVPDAAGGVLAVLAGAAAEVTHRGAELARRAWSGEVPSRASLVVAALSGPAEEQTWDNVARALAAAQRVVDEGGDMALCTELAAELGPALRALRGAEQPETLLRHIVHERPTDTLVAVQLLHALERGRVYLLSRLDESLVEELGMIPIADGEQLRRLVSRHTSCILIGSAQYAVPELPAGAEPADAATTTRSALDAAREQFG